jgi:hypothetical protein
MAVDGLVGQDPSLCGWRGLLSRKVSSELLSTLKRELAGMTLSLDEF